MASGRKNKWTICAVAASLVVLVLLALFLFLRFSDGGKPDKKEAVPTEKPTETVQESPTPAPRALSFTEQVKQDITDGNVDGLYEVLRYWDAMTDESGRFSRAMITEFVGRVQKDQNALDSFMTELDTFYEDGSDVVYLPAVYVQVTSDTDETKLSLPVFGEQMISDAQTKAQKLGPMLPMQYEIRAVNANWPEEKVQTIQITFEELNTDTAGAGESDAEMNGKHTYYVAFRGGNSVKSTEAPDSSDSKKTNSGSGRYVAIDAGHQAQGNNEKEPIGPGASTTKPKVASGTQGASTGTPEYELTLAVAQKLKAELQARGYEVLMIRESHDVNISNRERADMANNSGADIFVRIHADGADSSSAHGASTLYPGPDNPFVSSISAQSRVLSQEIVDGLCAATGASNRGAIIRDDMSGINWCTIPVSIVEMGFMTNPEEDELMETDAYRQKLAQGIADGIDAYFDQQ